MIKDTFKFRILNLGLFFLLFLNSTINAQTPSNLMTADYNFAVSDHVVSTTFFHWFEANMGQSEGPWMPVEGRANWTGDVEFWKRMIKQTMDANIDVFYVELIPYMEQSRINLFQALYELRMQGWDVPKVCPFLDPMITWDILGYNIDLSTASGKDDLVSHYIRFYDQYYSKNTDVFADDYIYTLDGKIVLNTWHLYTKMANYNLLTREDIAGRLSAYFGVAHPKFYNGIRMVTNAASPTYSFADEKVYQFEYNEYYKSITFNGITSAQIKAGYWDENIRNPGSFMPRNGGANYKTAWNSIPENVSRINIESFNEYDEGTGIFAANATTVKIAAINPHTDTWSTTNDPYEYIKTTAIGAAKFNGNKALNAQILWNNIPDVMYAGETYTAKIVVRNTGNEQWNNANEFKFGEQESNDPIMFGEARYLIDDTKDEIPEYGGVFRGRTKTFNIKIDVPTTLGSYVTHWGMLKENVAWFGDEITKTIQVVDGVRPPNNILTDFNGDFQNDLINWRFFEVPSSVGSTAVISSDAISGTKAVKVTYLNGAGVADRGFDNWDAHPPVIGGQVYNVKVFLKSDQAIGLSANIIFGFLDTNFNVIGQRSKVFNLTSNYSEYTIQGLAPANATSCWIAFRMTNATGSNVAGNMYIDNVQLYQVNFTDISNPPIDLNPVVDYTQWKIEKGKFFIGGKWTFLKIAKPLMNFASEADCDSLIAKLDIIKNKNYNTIEITCYWQFFDIDGDGIIDRSLAPLNKLINAIYSKGMYPCLGVETGTVGGGSLQPLFWANYPEAQAIDDKGNLVTDTEYGFGGKVVSFFHQGYRNASLAFVKNLARGISTKKILYFETSVEPQYMGTINLEFSNNAKLEYEKWRAANNIVDNTSKMSTSFPIPASFITNTTWNKFRAQSLARWVNEEAAAYREIAGNSAYVAVDYLDTGGNDIISRDGDPVEFLTSLTSANIIQVNWHWNFATNSPNQIAYDRVWKVINETKRDWAVAEHMTFNGSDYNLLNDQYLEQILNNTLNQGTRFGWEFVNVLNRSSDSFCLYNDDWIPKKTISMVDKHWGYWLNAANTFESLLTTENPSLLFSEVKSTIYPNPTSGVINLTSDNTIKSASIYNMAGQKVKEMNSNFTGVNVSNLHSGIYLVKIQTAGGESTQKLVVK